ADFRQTAGRLVGQVQDRLADIERVAEPAFAESPRLRDRLSSELEDGLAAVRRFLTLSSQAFSSQRGRPTVDAADYTAAADEARAALQSIHGAAIRSLRALLDERIDALNREKYLQLSGAVFILALTILLVLFLNRTITAQID